ncbi:gluconate 2-dehydrogenase subunit 3 family protein [Bordetella sp. H567]|uniref:gluconate 2-dehydrogenase subunit 3 family protein n=1 Tax=Bordetella sp. H567 TaxID=1697043 RepID=UPI000831631D|nr:gluconate 2-dehydrogenase subunit 3 family protein [Bordetella sp. H567]
MIPSRRNFLKRAGFAAATVGTVTTAPAALAAQAPEEQATFIFLTPEEAAFVHAAVARLIPQDEAGPGALEAGVPNYIDKQLGGAWGAGERLYRGGPWRQGAPTQGYQLPFTPAELFRNACRALRDEAAKGGTPFEKRPPAEQDAYLRDLQESTRDLNGVPANVFFESLWALTVEGFLSDPVYGGNKDMVSWKMIGFPGAYATYYDLVDQHGIDFHRAPMSLAEDGRGVIHVHPEVSASAGNAMAGTTSMPGHAPADTPPAAGQGPAQSQGGR